MENKITKRDYETAHSNGIKKGTVYMRVKKYGWEIERAITEKSTPKNDLGWNEWKDKCIVPYRTFASRVRSGMTKEEAATTPFIKQNERSYKSVFTEKEFDTARNNGISRINVLQRFNSLGWSKEDCISIPNMSRSESGKIGGINKKKNSISNKKSNTQEITRRI